MWHYFIKGRTIIENLEVFIVMKRYVAFLRGINISGKNKVPMAELKKAIEEFSFIEVKTYLNSGNVLFSSEEENISKLVEQIEGMIKQQFGLTIPVLVIAIENLKDILDHAPNWWRNDNKEIYDNLIFIMPPAKFSDVYAAIGEPKKELEKIDNYKDVIFWSFYRKDYQKNKLVV